jgi:pilus assembly protein CpaE
MPPPRSPQTGQASVEFVALLPFLTLAVAAVVQLVMLGHAAWAGSQAASAAARASAVGGSSRAAARAALPSHLERGLRVVDRGSGRVSVRLRVPSLVPALDLGSLSADGSFEEQA